MPDRMFRLGPPCWDETTTSRTWRDLVEVNAFTSSGIRAPAKVPQLTITDNFHHSPPGRSPMSNAEVAKVSTMQVIEVSQTRLLSGRSKSISSACS